MTLSGGIAMTASSRGISRSPRCWWILSQVCAAWLLFAGFGCSTSSGPSPTKESAILSAASEPASDAPDWSLIGKTLGKPGELREGVYTVTLPRDDLTVRIEGMDVPTAAGIESTFRFYQCSCGKTSVIGHFVLPDYEANDVVYALQKQDILVSSMGPFLLYEKPRLLEVRFQAEGKPQVLAQAIRAALDWTGKNRMPAQKLEP
jgi:hypothetical protein